MRFRKTLDGTLTAVSPLYAGTKVGYNLLEGKRLGHLKSLGAGLMLGLAANFGINEIVDKVAREQPTYSTREIVAKSVIPPYVKIGEYAFKR